MEDGDPEGEYLEEELGHAAGAADAGAGAAAGGALVAFGAGAAPLPQVNLLDVIAL